MYNKIVGRTEENRKIHWKYNKIKRLPEENKYKRREEKEGNKENSLRLTQRETEKDREIRLRVSLQI